MLALAAGGGLVVAHHPRARPGSRRVALAVIVTTALICFTTVGTLWFIPGPLLLIGAALTVHSCRDLAVAVWRNWTRVLVATLGGCQLVMAAGAAPTLMVVGGLSGLALIAAAVVAAHEYRVSAPLMVLGTVPFAILAWAAIVTLLVLLLAAGFAAPAPRPTSTSPSASAAARARRSASGGGCMSDRGSVIVRNWRGGVRCSRCRASATSPRPSEPSADAR